MSESPAHPRPVGGVSRLASDFRVVLGQMIRRLRTEHRVPMTQAAVLGRIDRDGPQSIGELASAESVRPQSMSQTLTELEALGLVTRLPDASDGRRARIELTAAGRAALADDRACRDGWLAQRISEFSAEDQAVIARATELMQELLAR